MNKKQSPYKRILLKLSGEALMGSKLFGLDSETIHRIAQEILEVYSLGIQIGIVIGGGNIFRGVAGGSVGMDRATADYMGMLATVMNSMALADALQKMGIETKVMSAINIDKIVEPYSQFKALEYLHKKSLVIFAAGTGNPFFTTDTAAVLRAAEINADIILKATKVDGVYDSDPKKNSAAKKFSSLTFDMALEKKLEIMDATAFALSRDRNLPIQVFSMLKPGALVRILNGENEGTLVCSVI